MSTSSAELSTADTVRKSGVADHQAMSICWRSRMSTSCHGVVAVAAARGWNCSARRAARSAIMCGDVPAAVSRSRGDHRSSAR